MPLIIVCLAILLVAVQLIPLPPSLWSALPGRGLLLEAARIAGEPQPWRPLAMVPSEAVNALFSLTIPLVAVLLAGACQPREQRFILIALIIAISVSGFVELAQIAGSGFSSPFVNGRPGQFGGLIANRNHQALLLAIGCAAVPVWAISSARSSAWRSWAALACVMLLVLLIVATGSRAGLLLGLLALMLTPATLGLKWQILRGETLRRHRWLLVAIAVTLAVMIALALWSGRSESFDRLHDMDTAADMRVRALPVVLALVRQHWMFGSGFGSFDTLFRSVEPFELLKPTYFNHAHNDILEVAMNGGLPAMALIAGALVWVTLRSVRIWSTATPLGRLGAVIVLLVFIASLFDYPARTPIVMTILVIAAVWMAGDEPPSRRRSTLTRP
ncbi:O-antigen ligase family protein [Sphingomonas sanguinis]|uniref:O-antigen ligase family protein n=1 Tax=Sphingomonas sanguinis TaxID=33051 RepID=UPI00187C871E|nr:O-antigen ligase family protein [Sphingomonas sanguinis]